jgi:pimeloyl-ACP methyl ester carboxylesterase
VQSGDDAWRDSVIAGWREAASSSGWVFSDEAAEEYNAGSFRRDESGTWHLRPQAKYQELLAPVARSLRMFEIYRANACPLLIYQCTRLFRTSDREVDEVFDVRKRNLARQLAALAADKANVRIRTLDASHMVNFDAPEVVAADILSLG